MKPFLDFVSIFMLDLPSEREFECLKKAGVAFTPSGFELRILRGFGVA